VSAGGWPLWAALLAAYVIGSVPTAHLVGRYHGVDLRTVGSGNLGATNVLRTFGWRWGAVVYAVDVLKGVVPVVGLPSLVAGGATPWVPIALGVSAIAGHVRPVFLLGQGGGKGVATASGVFLGLAPLPTAMVMVLFAVVVWRTRYVSAGSLAAAAMLPWVLAWQARGVGPLVIVGAAVAAFVFWTHRENIGRLRRGEERRLGGQPEGRG
jgi:glycerol-3-phosphate acyltransferase PlsY